MDAKITGFIRKLERIISDLEELQKTASLAAEYDPVLFLLTEELGALDFVEPELGDTDREPLADEMTDASRFLGLALEKTAGLPMSAIEKGRFMKRLNALKESVDKNIEERWQGKTEKGSAEWNELD